MAKNKHAPQQPAAAHRLLVTRNAEHEKKASEVMLRCELERVRLRSCMSESAPDESALKSPFTLSFNKPSSNVIGLQGPHLVTESSVLIESFDSSEEKQLVFRFGCAFQLEYHLDDDFKPNAEEMQAFAEAYAVFNAWPYVREALQSLTQRMGFSPPPLPLLRIIPSRHESAKRAAPLKRIKKSSPSKS